MTYKTTTILSIILLFGCKKNDESITPNANIQTVTSATGKVWMDRNLGAINVPSNFQDSDNYGDLYQWGRGKDGHENRNSATTSNLLSTGAKSSEFVINSKMFANWLSSDDNNLWQGVNGLNNPCPQGFRLPTKDEWIEEIATWSNRNSSGAFGSKLKLTVGGSRNYTNGLIEGAGVSSSYWSSSPGGTGSANLLYIEKGNAGVYASESRGWGLCIRCIKN